MNKTQKGAWVVLVLTAVLLIFGATIPLAWFSEVPALRTLPLLFFALVWIVMGLSFIFLRKKQSRTEVDIDERDVAIKRKAFFASYITLWILILIAYIISTAILGEEGSIKVVFLPIIIFGLFLFCMLAYSVTILVQYGQRGEKNE